ncbi:uncharacterized protein EI97DRAFT_432698 [Westerdykella ornata]|uniref:C2H2-type domain-containing protein n=1 Tax=Westerdykella ornata TaxID=318751 RepID=A0A6A6JKS4_WESOR|nr:uncharacterized protein EI97DRAFT_432698 [Westerdykella ornata]KAF2277082.1 hypothetical protein EI97DRAFT_432698 [Westerdykella ornata]
MVERGGKKGDWNCEACKVTFPYKSALKAHEKSKGHIERTKPKSKQLSNWLKTSV